MDGVPLLLPTSRGRRRRAWPAILVLLLAMAGLAGLTAWLEPALDFSADAARAWRLLLLNTLPAWLVLLALLGLTRRVLLSAWLTMLLVLALHAGNTAKMAMLETPLLPADFRIFAEPLPAIRLLGKYLHMQPLHWLALALGLALTALLVARPLLPRLRRLPGLGLLLAAVLAGASLLAGSAPWKALYAGRSLGFEPWALNESTGRVGITTALLLYQWEVRGGDIPAADRLAAAAFLDRHRERLAGMAQGGGQRPDIVVVQSESFMDPERIRGVGPGPWIPEFHRLSAHGGSGNLRVPTFVGGTIRTEFEFLTGAPLASLGGIQYPWLELSRAAYPGLARVLAGAGYESVAIHPNSAAFWNRSRAYPALGFDRFIDIAGFDRDRIVGLFISDAALTDRILEELPPKGPPRFVFAISMENHGPFDWRPNLDSERLDAIPMPDGLDRGGQLWFRNYLYLLADADHELGRLADILARRERHTLLLFFGDHLPGLGPVYHQLGFADGADALSQPVPWLLLDNRNPAPWRLDTHSWALPALLLRAAAIGGGFWFELLAGLVLDEGFDADDADEQAGLFALARLQLRGELDAFLAEAGLQPHPADGR